MNILKAADFTGTPHTKATVLNRYLYEKLCNQFIYFSLLLDRGRRTTL